MIRSAVRYHLAPRSRAVRLARMIAASVRDRAGRARIVPDRYQIRGDYRTREQPAYFDDAITDVVAQPDVYARAAVLAEQLGSKRIIDIGCGSGRKLAALHPSFAIVGIDYGPNLEGCRSDYPFGIWIEHDLESAATLPLETAQLDGAVLVASDVVEHLVRPDILLGAIRHALEEGARAAILSTPERDLTRGPGHLGPPPNPAHVREWTLREFAAFLAAEGLTNGIVELTRSNDAGPVRSSILATVAGDAAALAQIRAH
jgi:2-polyprenyl-3-methyl-5-hydroxy-6-metoxy-1,4-benzoquinol methylase